MALPQGFVLEQEQSAAPAGGLPAGFQLEETTPQKPKSSSSLGGLASLADITVGGVIPAAVQTLGYPLARLGRSPEEAQAATQRIVSAVDKPFGKALGVTETPEYQQEASRQLMDFIGQNFQKGAKWIAEKTGLPAADIESYMGTASLAAPALAKPVAKAASSVTAPLREQLTAGLKLPFEEQIQARKEAASLKDYERGPQIDAAKEARRLGLALDPVDIQPTAGSKVMSSLAGESGTRSIVDANRTQVRTIVLNELDLAPTSDLSKKGTFELARAKVAKPYEDVKKLPTMKADAAVLDALEALRPSDALISSDNLAKATSKIVDRAKEKVSGGLDGQALLQNVQDLRQRARKVYNNKSADLPALELADTQLAIANVLESMVESNIFNPKLLSQFRDARTKMARSYAYEAATDLNTGMVDVKKLGRITAKDSNLTGDIASLGQIAGNFPDAFTTKAITPRDKAVSIGRTGAAGTLGGVAGYLAGGDYFGAAVGSLLGAGLGEATQALAARRIASPAYQEGLKVRDMRIPVNQAAAAMQPIPQGQAIVPYQAPVEVLMPGEGPYQPNFVMQPNQYGPRVTTPGFAPGPAQLPAPSAQSTLGSLRAEDARRAGVSRALGQQAEAAQAAAEAAQRQSTRGAVELQINPLTGLPEISKGLMGASPETFSNFGSSLETAANKVTAGKKFDMTAAEKVAWDKTRVDLSEVSPGFKSLSDKAIAEKMLDRSWVEEAIVKARQKAQMQADIAARATTERKRQQALAERDKLMGIAEDMEESLRKSRPDVSGKQQGPKTRAAFREGLFSGIR